MGRATALHGGIGSDRHKGKAPIFVISVTKIAAAHVVLRGITYVVPQHLGQTFPEIWEHLTKPLNSKSVTYHTYSVYKNLSFNTNEVKYINIITLK